MNFSITLRLGSLIVNPIQIIVYKYTKEQKLCSPVKIAGENILLKNSTTG
jgi:hypothetical protein